MTQTTDISRQSLVCLRCGHGKTDGPWIRRKRGGLPLQCPKCRSVLWNTPRKNVSPGDSPKSMAKSAKALYDMAVPVEEILGDTHTINCQCTTCMVLRGEIR